MIYPPQFTNTTDSRFSGRWGKSSRSSDGNSCVMVQPAGELVGVCDSKAGPLGNVVAVDRAAWSTFISAVKGGQLG